MPRRNPGAAAAALVPVLLLAGCLGSSPQDPGAEAPAGGPSALLPATFRGHCDNAFLVQFVEYSQTDEFLPPGFHPSDAQNFVVASPVATGQAAVVFLVLSCQDADGRNYTAGSLDVFIEPPTVPGLIAADINFYQVERYGDPGPFAATLAAAGWPLREGSVFAESTDDALNEAEVFEANVTDDQGDLVRFSGMGAARVGLGLSVVRFWHDAPNGLAYVDHRADLNSTITGPGNCVVRAGTALAAFTGDPVGPPLPVLGSQACPPGDPLVATVPLLEIEAAAVFLPGVRVG